MLSPGGWLYIDDFNTWGGAKRAVHQWLEENGWGPEYTGLRLPKKGPLHMWKSNPYKVRRPFEPIIK